MKAKDIMSRLESKYPHESEYLQAVSEVLDSVEEIYNEHPEFEKARIIERLVEPDRVFTFKVTWVADSGFVQTNTGSRAPIRVACVSIRLSIYLCLNSWPLSKYLRML